MANLPKFRRTRTLNDDESVIPRYRKGYEFWGVMMEDGIIVEENGSLHSIFDVVQLDNK